MREDFEQKARQIAVEIHARAPSARSAFLEAQCQGDARLRARVEELLAHTTHADSFHTTQSLTFGASSTEPSERDEHTASLEPNSVIANRYRVVSRLGSGGEGQVYRAVDTMLEVDVAIKFLHRNRTRNTALLANEVRLARQIVHPAVCRVYDIASSKYGDFSTMEYIEGDDLRTVLRRFGRLSVERVIRIGCEICDGLDAAHSKGVLHRDLKPSNIMIDLQGQVRIMDFGLAIGDGPQAQPRTRAGMGTPPYMAPEQWQMQAVTAKTDLYALGLTLYELLTNRRVFRADSLPALKYEVLNNTPPPPSRILPNVGTGLDQVIMRLIEKDPDKRPDSAQEVVESLRKRSQAHIERLDSDHFVSGQRAERRQISVMVCHLLNAMEIGQQLEPEDLFEVIRGFEELQDHTVHEFSGSGVRRTTDMHLGYFGLPHAHENDPERAVRTAMSLLGKCAHYNGQLSRRFGVKLAVAISVHTGPVVVGDTGGIDSGYWKIVGDTIDVATQLAKSADPESVVISSVTHQRIAGLFLTKDLGEQILWAGARPVHAFSVIQPSGMRSRLALLRTGRLTQFVGREQEVELIAARWEKIEEGMGHGILLCGEAGFGKSRLIQRVAERFADVAHGWYEIECNPFTQNSSFYPIIRFFEEDILAFTEADSAQERLRRLDEAATLLGLPAADVVQLVGALLALPVADKPDMPALTPELKRRKMLDILLQWLFALSKEQPSIFVIEDIHWCDPSTMELLGRMIEQLPTVPLLLIMTYRPEFEPPWPPRSHMTPVYLSTLSRRQTRQLVAAAAQTTVLSSQELDGIVARADGVPLFAEELTKMVVDSRSQSAEYAPSASEDAGNNGQEVSIPGNLQESLIARLDQMGTAKEIAQQGAVLGRSFSYELIRDIVDHDEEALQAALTRLTTENLVYQRSEPPNALYTFKHALVRDAAYHSMVRRQRKNIHARVVEALLQRSEYAQNRPELLAHHSQNCECYDDAIEYWYLAGERCTASSAHHEAIEHLQHGLALIPELVPSLERDQLELKFLAMLSVCQIATSGYASADVGHSFTRAQILYQKLPRTPDLFRLLYSTYLFYVVRAHREQTPVIAEQLLQTADTYDDQAMQLVAYSSLGEVEFYAARYRESIAYMDKTIAMYNIDDREMHDLLSGADPCSNAYMYASWSYWLLGRPDHAWQMASQGLALAEDIGHAFSIAHALSFAASVALNRGDFAQALTMSTRNIALSGEQGFVLWLAVAKIQKGRANVSMNQREEGMRELEEGFAILAQTGSNLQVPQLMCYLAEAQLITERYSEGLDTVRQALLMVATNLDVYYEAELHRLEGALLGARTRASSTGMAADEGERIAVCFNTALTVAREQKARSLELRAATGLSQYYEEVGEVARARAILRPVYDAFSEGFDTADLTRAHSVLRRLESGGP